MAFLIDRGIAAESEEEFDADGDRYEELRSRLLGGRTMKYEEMEELLAAAKARNDQKVVDALKNVVDDPVTEAVFEEEIPDFPADEFKGCPNHPDGDKRPETQYKFKDKYGRWIIVDKAKPKKDTLRKNKTGMNSIASAAADRLLEGGFDVDVESSTAIRLNGGKTADEDEITSMLADLGICAQEVSPGVFELDWTDPVAGITDEIEEKEELLPDCVISEAIETLRRMY